MEKFIYEARDQTGKIRTGIVEAENEEAVSLLLKANRLTLISLRPKIEPSKLIISYLINFVYRVTAKDKAMFARQLATMISAGLPLMQSLRLLAAQNEKRGIGKIIIRVIKAIEGGKSFAMAVAAHPTVFNSIFVSMVKSGEASGKLDAVLTELADQMEKDLALSGRVKSAMVYPAFIFLAILGVGTFMLIFVIPQLKPLFEEAKIELPLLTRILIGLSDFLVRWWFLVAGLLVIAAIVFKFLVSLSTGKKYWHLFMIYMPVFGRINKGIIVSRFSRTLSLLLIGGVPILEAISMSGEATGNLIYEWQIKGFLGEVEKGIPLSVPISKSKYFPKMVSDMVSVGEQTGQLDSLLVSLAKSYETETENLIRGISALIEPVIMIFLGIAVAFIVFAILVPVFKITQSF